MKAQLTPEVISRVCHKVEDVLEDEEKKVFVGLLRTYTKKYPEVFTLLEKQGAVKEEAVRDWIAGRGPTPR